MKDLSPLLVIQSDLNCFLLLFMTLELVKHGFAVIIFLYTLNLFFCHLCVTGGIKLLQVKKINLCKQVKKLLVFRL